MIKDIKFSEQSALFARFSNIAYKELVDARKLFKLLGYKTTYYENDGSNVYVIEDATDIIVVCRGTEVKEKGDIKADLNIDLCPSRGGVGQVHRGFRTYTDKVWDFVKDHVQKTPQKELWLTGHSLGAAMATLMARRFTLDTTLPTPKALFTYGSPRVGNRKYINAFNNALVHHRWVNEGDIVTKVPISPWYYHCGTRHHIGQSGIITAEMARKDLLMTLCNVIFTFGKGIFSKIKDDAQDHSSELYAQRLTFWAENDVQ